MPPVVQSAGPSPDTDAGMHGTTASVCTGANAFRYMVLSAGVNEGALHLRTGRLIRGRRNVKYSMAQCGEGGEKLREAKSSDSVVQYRLCSE